MSRGSSARVPLDWASLSPGTQSLWVITPPADVPLAAHTASRGFGEGRDNRLAHIQNALLDPQPRPVLVDVAETVPGLHEREAIPLRRAQQG